MSLTPRQVDQAQTSTNIGSDDKRSYRPTMPHEGGTFQLPYSQPNQQPQLFAQQQHFGMYTPMPGNFAMVNSQNGHGGRASAAQPGMSIPPFQQQQHPHVHEQRVPNGLPSKPASTDASLSPATALQAFVPPTAMGGGGGGGYVMAPQLPHDQRSSGAPPITSFSMAQQAHPAAYAMASPSMNMFPHYQGFSGFVPGPPPTGVPMSTFMVGGQRVSPHHHQPAEHGSNQPLPGQASMEGSRGKPSSNQTRKEAGAAATDLVVSELLNNPENLTSMSSRDLKRLLRTTSLTDKDKARIKAARRKFKNRVYARLSRQRRQIAEEEVERQPLDMNDGELRSEVTRLRIEVKRLRALLVSHGVDASIVGPSLAAAATPPSSSDGNTSSSTSRKTSRDIISTLAAAAATRNQKDNDKQVHLSRADARLSSSAPHDDSSFDDDDDSDSDGGIDDDATSQTVTDDGEPAAKRAK